MPRSAQTLNLEAVLQAGITPDSLFDSVLPNPYPSLPPIVDFAMRTDNSGLALTDSLYPRQKTLLRLMFLETDEMTAYDVDVIEKWRNQFYSGPDRIGLPPDIWERIDWCINNGYDHFREVIFIGGRRGGKGYLGAIVGSRQMYRLIRMNVPQAVYGISHDKELMLFVTATNFTQARDNQFKDLHDMVGHAPAFDRWRGSMKNYRIRLRTPYDEQRIMMLRGWGARIDSEIASIQAMAISANSKAARGFAAFGNFYDEMAHMQTGTLGPRTAEEVYQALTPALDQMGPGGRDSIIYVPTSPYTQIGQAYALYEDALATDTDTGAPTNPDMLVIQLPSWDPYEDWDDLEATEGHHFYGAPSLYNEGMKRIERRDKARFRVERKSQWAAQIDAYLDPIMVDQIFAPFDGEVLEMRPHGLLAHSYRAHIDPGKSQANFAFTIGHTEPVAEHDVDENGKTIERVWHHVFIDYMRVWRPGDFDMDPEDMEYIEDPESGVWHPMMDYIAIKDEIVKWMAKFPTTYVLSVDNYGAFATLSDLRRAMRKMHHQARVKEEAFNPRQNQIRAERFKTALGMGWVHAPRDTYHGDNEESLLEKEAKFVQEKPPGSGKLVPPTTGEVRTKDLLDTVMVVTTELLADQLERLERRENLADARIAMGVQGGYNTKMEPESAIQSAIASGRRANPRAMMEQHRRTGVTRSNPYGGRRGR